MGFVPQPTLRLLDVMRSLAEGGMTMVIVTHEVGFAREVADHVLLMDQGQVVERATPAEFFLNPKEERSRQFLAQILT
jgi:general L-amino acid transport system ATP-binding protein